MQWLGFEPILTQALKLDLPYDHHWNRSMEREAAVLILFGCDPSGRASLLLTRRTEHVETHKGQVAFPGGLVDEADHLSQGVISTALRETFEEVGLSPQNISILGDLPEICTGTGFKVTPIVALLAEGLAGEIPMVLSAHEIAEAFWVPLEDLNNPAHYRQEFFEIPGPDPLKIPTSAYYVGGHRVWGVTAGMIKNLLNRLSAVTSSK